MCKMNPSTKGVETERTRLLHRLKIIIPYHRKRNTPLQTSHPCYKEIFAQPQNLPSDHDKKRA
jgi:hypothetical protein